MLAVVGTAAMGKAERNEGDNLEEFVADLDSHEPFPAAMKVSAKLFDKAFDLGLIVYPGSGSVDGSAGDHVMVSPPFVVTEDQMDEIISRLSEAMSGCIPPG